MSTVPPPPSYEQATGDPDAAYPPPHGIQGPAYPPPTDPYGMNTPYPPGETGPQTAFMPPHTATYETNPDPPPMTHASSDTAVESGGFESASSFSDKTVRRMFIRKVYLILMVQLLVTMGIIALFVFSSSVKFFVQQNSWLYWISYGLFIIFYIFLVCCEKIRRSYPTNIIMLALFTLCLSYMAGTISSYYDIRSVMIAFGISAGVCFGVTIFSMQTKFDFTTCGGLLFMCSLALFLFGIVSIFTYNHILQTVYAGLGALLFSAFLAFDTQLIMGGKRYELSPEEYIFASINLYIDVVYIFLFLLRLVGGGSVFICSPFLYNVVTHEKI
ncbi:protein lifeguard 2-like [Glandiceps talaboti]